MATLFFLSPVGYGVSLIFSEAVLMLVQACFYTYFNFIFFLAVMSEL